MEPQPSRFVAEEAAPRPSALTAICLLGFVGSLFVGYSLLSDWSLLASYLGAWYPPTLLMSSVVGVVAMVGMWNMKKWGVFVYTAGSALGMLVNLSSGHANAMGFVVPLAVLAVAWGNLSKMS